MMNELKPCPFCGCEVKVEYKRIMRKYTVVGWHDEKCAFQHLLWELGYETEEEAKEAWNRRQNDE